MTFARKHVAWAIAGTYELRHGAATVAGIVAIYGLILPEGVHPADVVADLVGGPDGWELAWSAGPIYTRVGEQLPLPLE